MSTSEFPRLIDERQVTPKAISIEATADEREALARRFGLVAINQLQATVAIERDGEALNARGRLFASIVQSEDEEVELDADELDEIPFESHAFDLGEAVAQSLALAIDPYATGPEADRVRKEAGLGDETTSGPFAALAALKKT